MFASLGDFSSGSRSTCHDLSGYVRFGPTNLTELPYLRGRSQAFVFGEAASTFAFAHVVDARGGDTWIAPGDAWASILGGAFVSDNNSSGT